MFLPEVKSQIGEDISILIKLDNHSPYCFNQVFIESYYLAADKEQANLNHHSYATASGKIMQQCQIKKAIPVHFPRRYDTEKVELLIKEFNAAYRGLS